MPPRESWSHSNFSNGQESRDCLALCKSCRMLRPPGGLQGSAAGLRCQEEGAILAEFRVHCDFKRFWWQLHGCHLFLGKGVKHLPLHWFECVCAGGPGTQVWMGTTTTVGNVFFQNGVLKGPGGGVYSSLAWGLAVCLALGGSRYWICGSFSGTLRQHTHTHIHTLQEVETV